MRSLWIWLVCALPALAGGGPENVLVVQNDLCPDSAEIARHYILRRDVPRHHVVHVRIPGAPVKPPPKKDPKAPPAPAWEPRESFASFDEYQALLETPVKNWIARHPESRITIVAITRGIPVCTPTKNATGNDIVRSTTHILAAMFAEKDDVRTGPAGHTGLSSPFYKHDGSIDPREPIGGEWKMLVSTTLDAFNAADAKKAIDLAILSDTKRPDGTVYLGISAAGDPRGMYNPNFPKLDGVLQGLGMKTATIPHNPKNLLLEGKKDVALYLFGQANWDPAFPALNAFQPGCLVDNITSVALTWRCFVEPPGGGQTPMTWFTKAGATVIHGCVREPTTGAWDPEYLHVQRFADGYNVAESFFMGHPWFPWMNLVAGDPLTQPFAKRPTVTATVGGAKGAWTLTAGAKPARDGAGIRSIEVFVDGVFYKEAKDGEAVALPETFDPAVNAWKVVATEDTKYRTQGFAASEAPKKETSKVSVKFDSMYKGAAAFRATFDGKEPVIVWVAPDAKERTGVVKGSRFKIEFENETEPHLVEFWVRNGKVEQPPIVIEIPAKKK